MELGQESREMGWEGGGRWLFAQYRVEPRRNRWDLQREDTAVKVWCDGERE